MSIPLLHLVLSLLLNPSKTKVVILHGSFILSPDKLEKKMGISSQTMFFFFFFKPLPSQVSLLKWVNVRCLILI